MSGEDAKDTKDSQDALDRTVNSQVHFILNPLSYEHNLLRGFVDEGVGLQLAGNDSLANGAAKCAANCAGQRKVEKKNVGEIRERLPSSSSSSSSSSRGRKSRLGEGKSGAKDNREPRRSGIGSDGGGHHREEVYTDKDRAAAVNMGSKDIKHSLRIKGREDRVRSAYGQPEEMEPSSLLVRALRELRCGNVESGITSINQALDINPKDRNALIARCRCYLLLGEPRKALKDAEAILARESRDSCYARAIYYKAEALYQLGCFEMSLVYYTRGQRIRPELDQFRLGVQKATNAIRQLLWKK